MIRLFVTDIDGCLATPYEAFDIAGLTRLRRLATAGDLPLTICSGRSYSYVEAFCQLLDIRTPALFEAGGAMFDPVSAKCEWHPAFSTEIEEQLEAVRPWLKSLVPGTSLSYDFGKRTQAGLVGPISSEIYATAEIVAQTLESDFPDLTSHYTWISIDVLPRALTKEHGMTWLADRLGLAVAEVAYIGDSGGDLLALRNVGLSFAPANATPEIREAVDVVTSGSTLDGVLEAYEMTRNGSFPTEPGGFETV